MPAAGGDADGDGVPDALDACPNTPPGDPVDASGCSLCPCKGPSAGGRWASHTAYLRCVRATARGLGLPQTMVDSARRSSCGRTAATRCCTFTAATDKRGTCRILRRDTCAVRSAIGRAADLGAGTCAVTSCSRP